MGFEELVSTLLDGNRLRLAAIASLIPIVGFLSLHSSDTTHGLPSEEISTRSSEAPNHWKLVGCR